MSGKRSIDLNTPNAPAGQTGARNMNVIGGLTSGNLKKMGATGMGNVENPDEITHNYTDPNAAQHMHHGNASRNGGEAIPIRKNFAPATIQTESVLA